MPLPYYPKISTHYGKLDLALLIIRESLYEVFRLLKLTEEILVIKRYLPLIRSVELYETLPTLR